MLVKLPTLLPDCVKILMNGLSKSFHSKNWKGLSNLKNDVTSLFHPWLIGSSSLLSEEAGLIIFCFSFSIATKTKVNFNFTSKTK